MGRKRSSAALHHANNLGSESGSESALRSPIELEKMATYAFQFIVYLAGNSSRLSGHTLHASDNGDSCSEEETRTYS